MRFLIPLLAFLATAHAIPTARDASVLITSTPPLAAADCLANAYYGSYGGDQSEHIYLPSSDCLDGGSLASLGSGSIVPLSARGGRLVWVGRAGVEGDTSDVAAEWTGIETMAIRLATDPASFGSVSRTEGGADLLTGHPGQAVIGHLASLSLLHASAGSLLLHVPTAILPLIDTLLPPHLVPVVLPLAPFPPRSAEPASDGEVAVSEWKSVPVHYARHLANLTSTLRFEPALDKALGEITMDQVRRNVRWLTGEGPSGITSRHSFTPGAIKAAHWIKSELISQPSHTGSTVGLYRCIDCSPEYL